MTIQELAPAQVRIVAEIQRVAADLNVDRLSQDEFDRHHRLGGVTTAASNFGSWNAAVKAAGLTPYEPGRGKADPKLSDEELLRDLLRIEVELRTILSERKVAFFSKYSLKPYKKRWGSVARAIQRAHELYGNPTR